MRNRIARGSVPRCGTSARVTLAIFQHNCAPSINKRFYKGELGKGEGGRCYPANEVQHENVSSRRREEPPRRALTGARRTRCLAVKLRAQVIKPNVNCVITPRLRSARLASAAREAAAIERSAVFQPLAHSSLLFLAAPAESCRGAPRCYHSRCGTAVETRPWKRKRSA